VSLALATGQSELAKRTLEAAKTARIDPEIKEDGSQPLELARTKSFGYSLMNLRAFFELAEMGQKLGVDLWHTRVRAAFEYLLPYYADKPWPHDELGGVTQGDRHDLLALGKRAAIAYSQIGYDHTICHTTAERFEILWPSTAEVLCH
jgi:hypothetical protein